MKYYQKIKKSREENPQTYKRIEDDGTYLQYLIKDSETLYDISIVKIKKLL